MMNDNRWFVPYEDYTDYCFNIPMEFKAGKKYETYYFDPDYTTVKCNNCYIGYGPKTLAALGQIVIGPNPTEQEKQYFEELDKLIDGDDTDEKWQEAIQKLGPIPFG